MKSVSQWAFTTDVNSIAIKSRVGFIGCDLALGLINLQGAELINVRECEMLTVCHEAGGL